VKEALIVNERRENELRWFGRVMADEERGNGSSSERGYELVRMTVEGRRGRQKKR